MLCERLCEEIPDIQMLQANTDGISFKVNKKYVEQVYSICKRWEVFTKLNLESVQYSKMIISNVNNYIAIKTDGDVKRKGASFIHKIAPGELEWHKNFSALVVPKALEQYYLNNTSVEKFIYNHDNVYDFFKRTKINKADKLFLRNDTDVEIQRVSRYYISGSYKYNKTDKEFVVIGNGGSLIKEMLPLVQKETKKLKLDYDRIIKKGENISYEDYKKSLIKNRNTNLESTFLCTVVNDMSKADVKEIKKNIYYQYYIDECYKIINTIK
jgi:hypothetical protein